MNKDFELFQSEFKKWQYKFGLTGYRVYFKHEPLDSGFARISVKQNDMVATLSLNSRILKKHEPFKDVKCSAKHEALHLLLMKMECCASARYVSEREIYEASEELVTKLEGLINDN